MVAGSRHHALYAHTRQRAEKEQSRLRPGAIYLLAREQQLSLSGRRATELCRLFRSQSRPCLYRQCETLRSLLTKSTMHDWTLQVSRHSHPRVGTTTRPGVGADPRVFQGTTTAIGLRRLRLRRLKFVREQFFLAAAAQNIKRLVRFLTPSTTPALAATT